VSDLPDMSEVVEDWADDRTVKTVTRQTVDFEQADVVTLRTVRAMIQPADPRKLNVEQIDWSKRYILLHALTELAIDELVEYRGADHKIISHTGWTEYGYDRAVAKSTNKPLVEPTP